MTMAASTMAPMAMAMPPRLMMLEPMPSACMAMKAISTPTGRVTMATSAERTCSRKTTQTAATTRHSSIRVDLQRGDGAMDQLRAVVDGLDTHALGQAGRCPRSGLDVVDDVERVLAEALQGDATHRLALAVELGDAAPLVGSQLDPRHVARSAPGSARRP